MEPRPGGTPVALHRLRRDAECGRYLFNRKPAIKAQIHNLGLPRIPFTEFLESFIKGDELIGTLPNQCQRVCQFDAIMIAGAFYRGAAACIGDQNPAHCLGCGGIEMTAIFPIGSCSAKQLDPCFVDECRGLQGVIGAFPQEEVGREDMELGMNVLQQQLFRVFFSVAGAVKQLSDVFHTDLSCADLKEKGS